MFDDISFLVQETFKDSESKSSKNFLSNFFGKNEELPDEVPGFFYNLQKKSSTFVIRIFPTNNLKQEYNNITNHPDLYPSLRLEEDDKPLREKLKFFECDRVEIAQKIKAHLGNKRFPIFEEHIFNVSDPGDSWWYKDNDNEISIHFKLSRTEDIGQLTKLGPLGDSVESLELFKQLFGYFKLIFPVENYSSGHGQVNMSVTNEDQMFTYFKQLLVDGETSHEFWEFLRNLEMTSQEKPYLESLQKANYFMMELSFIRHFWKTIEEQLS